MISHAEAPSIMERSEIPSSADLSTAFDLATKPSADWTNGDRYLLLQVAYEIDKRDDTRDRRQFDTLTKSVHNAKFIDLHSRN